MHDDMKMELQDEDWFPFLWDCWLSSGPPLSHVFFSLTDIGFGDPQARFTEVSDYLDAVLVIIKTRISRGGAF